MKIEQQQREQVSPVIRFYKFLRDRDARIIELFFLALNTYILVFIVFPPYSYTGIALIVRIVIQISVTILNTTALIQQRLGIRIISAIANAAIMGLITATLIDSLSPHAGTYGLLTLLAAFVCWKINLRS